MKENLPLNFDITLRCQINESIIKWKDCFQTLWENLHPKFDRIKIMLNWKLYNGCHLLIVLQQNNSSVKYNIVMSRYYCAAK